MRKFAAPLLTVCIGVYVTACGPTADDQPASDDTRVDTPEATPETSPNNTLEQSIKENPDETPAGRPDDSPGQPVPGEEDIEEVLRIRIIRTPTFLQ